MPKLSDTQAVLLATAAARSDLSVLPPPETLTLKGAALERTLSALIRRGLIAEAAVERRARKSKWAVAEDDPRKPQRLVITPAGLDAIGVEHGTGGAATATRPATLPVTPAGVAFGAAGRQAGGAARRGLASRRGDARGPDGSVGLAAAHHARRHHPAPPAGRLRLIRKQRGTG